ncbi:ImuA family protein [Albibacterium indicum]|uniref:ImuA family protein n=1 Tax=Albibacterium indicum TaxID=2292082 RepID=UPI000E48698C|nr:Error-prone repair protein ImuA [Pedobacter indicus]
MKQELINKLKKDILLWQGYKPQSNETDRGIELREIEAAFPNGIFPKGTIHEFIGTRAEHSATSVGFIAVLLSILLNEDDVCLWISTNRKLFPVSLRMFNVNPEQIIFVDVATEKECLWVIEEALKCEGLSAVIAEVNSLNFIESRRLQLAVEKTGVTGFIIRKDNRKEIAAVTAARWKITPVPSETNAGLPGIGFPRWNVELIKVRNGSPRSWVFEWSGDKLINIPFIQQEKRRWFDFQKKQSG